MNCKRNVYARNRKKIAELRKLGKLTAITTNSSVILTLVIGNYRRKYTSTYGMLDAIDGLHKSIVLCKPLIEALNSE